MRYTAGPSAIHYFEEAFPEVTPFGSKGLYHNKAEWIVDLTTKARAGAFLGVTHLVGDSTTPGPISELGLLQPRASSCHVKDGQLSTTAWASPAFAGAIHCS